MSPIDNVFSIEQLFSGRLFRVPDYQRGYAWEPQQRQEFLEDLEMLGSGREHYTGTIVLHEVAPDKRRLDSEGRSYGTVDVVDGQQRLATIVLLLDAIRRSLASLPDEPSRALAAGIKRTYIAASDRAGQSLYKLSLNSDVDHYYKTSTISDEPGPEGPQISSERRLAEARVEFENYLDGQQAFQGDGFQAWLTNLYLKVTNQLRVSLYEVDSAAEVGVIFEVMNNRGKPLSELEKVKNFLLYAGSTLSLPHELDVSVNAAWAEIFRQLMAAGLTSSPDEDQLLRAHWLTAYDPQPRQWAGSKAIKARFDLRSLRGVPGARFELGAYKTPQARLLDGLLRYTEGLRGSCIGYCDARAPERADSFASMGPLAVRGEVMRWSAKLIRTNVVAPFMPLLIATRTRSSEDAEKYLEVVKLCEAFAFRVYRLLERRADAGQGDLFLIGYQLHEGSISFEEATRRLRSTLLTFCPEVRFEEALSREDYDWYSWAGLKYFLYEYEEHLAGKRGAVPRISWDEVRRRERADTIEHILPQTPTDPYWLDRFDMEARRKLTHDIGNLSLTKDNASYGNKPFLEKRGAPGSKSPCYAESPFFIERELATLEDWNTGQVAERRTRLMDWARERWHIAADDTSDQPASSLEEPDDEESDETSRLPSDLEAEMDPGTS